MKSKDTCALLDNLTADLTTEDILFAGIKGIIAAEISVKRQSLGMNQKQFAEYMDVSQGMVSKWETGEANFTLQTLAKIAIKLDLPMQSPFVPKKPPVYYSGVTDIVDFRNVATWSSVSNTSGSYERVDLKEM